MTQTLNGLHEETLQSQEMCRGNFLHLFRDTVQLPNGKTATREYIKHPGAVVIVPILDDGRLVMERQFRYPTGRVMIEFPAGKLDPQEAPIACAVRELAEETGFMASAWAYAGAMRIAVAYSDEVIHIFFARGLKQGAQKLDPDEFLDVYWAHQSEVFASVQNGTLIDAKTLSCLLWLQNVQNKAWTLQWQTADELAAHYYRTLAQKVST